MTRIERFVELAEGGCKECRDALETSHTGVFVTACAHYPIGDVVLLQLDNEVLPGIAWQISASSRVAMGSRDAEDAWDMQFPEGFFPYGQIVAAVEHYKEHCAKLAATSIP